MVQENSAEIAGLPEAPQEPALASWRSLLMINGTPRNYECWLAEAIRKTVNDFPGQERLVFINAWNEWAEGCHLEPDRAFGRQFLEATLTAKNNAATRQTFADTAVPRLPTFPFLAAIDKVLFSRLGMLNHWSRSRLNRHPKLKAVLKSILGLVRPKYDPGHQQLDEDSTACRSAQNPRSPGNYRELPCDGPKDGEARGENHGENRILVIKSESHG
ncbi:MAG: glycoside hydrolase family 99-like domain-containing protein [Desulfomonile tiedjei]|nr:glycoside hydrolase family 99-like domain-containing protein [Desulfomonile tiedjei]